MGLEQGFGTGGIKPRKESSRLPAGSTRVPPSLERRWRGPRQPSSWRRPSMMKPALDCNFYSIVPLRSKLSPNGPLYASRKRTLLK